MAVKKKKLAELSPANWGGVMGGIVSSKEDTLES